MAFKKNSHKNLYIAVFLIVLLVASTAAVIYATLPRPQVATVGVKVGDTFTYSITGVSTLQGTGATMTPGFEQYNQTDYYKITITGLDRDLVSFDTLWRFLNGTEVNGQQTLNLTDGRQSVQNGFWAMYSANLNVGERIRPTDDRLTVNQTDTKTYADSSRPRDFWSIENQFFDVNDPTHNTLRDDYTGVWFDKQTGMLETLNSITYYNNPLKTEAITWKLVASNVWAVK
jgi:hypothetical protein